MARKVSDACMFCMGAGCEVCVKPTKKSAKPKPVKQAPLTPQIAESLGTPPAPRVDIKAAMKSVATLQTQAKEEDEHDLLEALVALEPILHPDELARVAGQLDAYKPRAQRWRERREQLGLS